ncbi:hypothetical protein L202_01831 [Cryptococcus amylolentus CBS 6039]|uniref:HCNGP-like protein n=2 Tax=Cryptococcus amylolentus TaxID=104669 RepID=A0A1E3I557_9TREE|nr:hypothetical protein L202_01831 [Cryptococcus amylolentus CBS 6039]ODN83739.1 hypothetical protein L202_01831 [Cryptococcus amylolentus CBS 6039]ODO11205.1 hypothetical protein I350_01809 [Cryptococcus amylolentus CBS 6273]
MQGLVHYSDDSSPEAQSRPQAQAGPSVSLPRISLEEYLITRRHYNARPISKPSTPAGIILHKNSPASNHRPTKRRRQSPAPADAISILPPDANLTQAAQSSLPDSAQAPGLAPLDAKPSIIDQAREQGLDDDEILDLVLRPGPLDGDEEWGLPAEVDPGHCDPALSAKVAHFLKLKYEQGEHINTRLLSSSTFANPHIYSQLVDFVSIDERAPSFPSPSPSSSSSGGWLTRQNLESLIPQYGPSALTSQQKERDKKSEEAKKAGTKRGIVFGKGKYENGEGRRDRERERDRRR